MHLTETNSWGPDLLNIFNKNKNKNNIHAIGQLFAGNTCYIFCPKNK
jgi:hypothetical protein